MRGSKIKKLAVVALLGAAVAAIMKALRGEPTPVFSNHPTVTGGPSAAKTTSTATPTPAPASTAAPEPVAPKPVTAAPKASKVPKATEAPAGDQAWVAPVDGACPDGYPIKAKVKSGIFHQPGTSTYERTKPDRCYPTVEAAEADGLRPPKR